ncbi:DUF547 domain-containing protein [Dokdonia sp.]|uniref:DUF547 domain-containing protein n=1 Tax=Dokdonia sp. TaxID=2024995 RepID=UPI003267F2CA
MTFDSRSFSKDLKIARYAHQYGDVVHQELIKKHLAQLKEVDLTTLVSDVEKMTFWINVYNGMTNYAIIQYEIKQSMKEDPHFFKHPLFKIGTISFSLDDIEHGILRRNARNHIETGNSKLTYMVDKIDYRIHFALNCGAQSCPAIAFYTEENLEEELAIAKASFISQEFIINNENQTISCSSLFEWYKEDFGDLFLQDPKYNDYAVTLKEYDWRI